jgi:hypothetical protein
VISGKIVGVKKAVICGIDTYVVTVTNSKGMVMWTSDDLGRDHTIDALVAIGLPAKEIRDKLADAEYPRRAKDAAAA